jgi:hypothetical protein
MVRGLDKWSHGVAKDQTKKLLLAIEAAKVVDRNMNRNDPRSWRMAGGTTGAEVGIHGGRNAGRRRLGGKGEYDRMEFRTFQSPPGSAVRHAPHHYVRWC